MSPEDPNNPGLNTKNPDFDSVPLPEPTPIKSPYAPVGGTLGEIADDVTANDHNSDSEASSPIPTAGIINENTDQSTPPSATPVSDSSNTSAPQSTPAQTPKKNKLPLIIGIIVALLVIGIVVFIIVAKPFGGGNGNGGNGGNGNMSGGSDSFMESKSLAVSSEEKSKKQFAIFSSDGEAITDFVYTELPDQFIAGAILARKDDSYAIVDEAGKEIVEFGKYNKIRPVGGLYWVEQNGENILLNNKGEKVVTASEDSLKESSKNYSGDGKTAYTLLRTKGNHYEVYSPYGNKAIEFDSAIMPTISTPNMGVKGAFTVVVYSNGVILLDDKGSEVRKVEKPITKRLFGVFTSKSGNVVGLSTINRPVELNFINSTTTPDDNRDNALVVGNNIYDFDHKLCLGLYYDDADVKDEDGRVVCIRSNIDRHLIQLDGEITASTFYLNNNLLDQLITPKSQHQIGINNYAVRNDEKSMSIMYNGKNVAQFVDDKAETTDKKAFTKTTTEKEYKMAGISDNYVVHRRTIETIDEYTDENMTTIKKSSTKAKGELLFIDKQGKTTCTFDKPGYYNTTVKTNELISKPTIYGIESDSVVGFMNGVALVAKDASKGQGFKENGFSRINNKCEIVEPDVVYLSINRAGDFIIANKRAKNGMFTHDIINQNGETLDSFTSKYEMPTFVNFGRHFVSVDFNGSLHFFGYNKLLKKLDNTTIPGSGLEYNNSYDYVKYSFKAPMGGGHNGGTETLYFLPDGKEFYHWSTANTK